jgi:hypothetical protein
MPTLTTLLLMLRALVLDRQRLLLENLALRQQVVVLKRSVKRPHLRDADRTFWIFMRKALRDWKGCLLLVTPDTVVRWHRQGWRYYWARKSWPRRVGRPPIGWRLVYLIKRLSSENPLWGRAAQPGRAGAARAHGRRVERRQVHGPQAER